MNKTLKIKTRDLNSSIEITNEIYDHSKYLSDIVKNSNELGNLHDVIEITLENIDNNTLNRIIIFLKYYNIKPFNEIPKPLSKNNLNFYVSQWYCDFINKIEMDDIFRLIQASNFLEIKSLLDISCAKIATTIKTKPVEEIREIFGITNDFTKEEEDSIIAESKWCENIE